MAEGVTIIMTILIKINVIYAIIENRGEGTLRIGYCNAHNQAVVE